MNSSLPAQTVLVATAEFLPGFEIRAILGEVLGVASRSLSPYTEGFRSWSDGGSVTPDKRIELLTNSRMEAIDRMRAAAHARGANAVIAMRFDHRQVTESSNEICAYGTAVILAAVDDRAAQTGVQPVTLPAAA